LEIIMHAKLLYRHAVIALFSAGLLIAAPAAKAELIGTQQLTHSAQITQDRQTVDAFLARADVQAKLQELGLTQTVSAQRVAALSDSEIAELAGKINSLPAAGYLGFQELVIILLVAILVVLAV
jgi:hypothetical protein